jgi:hypothetical protein
MRKIHGEAPVRTASTVRITPTAVSAAIPDGSCPVRRAAGLSRNLDVISVEEL